MSLVSFAGTTLVTRDGHERPINDKGVVANIAALPLVGNEGGDKFTVLDSDGAGNPGIRVWDDTPPPGAWVDPTVGGVPGPHTIESHTTGGIDNQVAVTSSGGVVLQPYVSGGGDVVGPASATDHAVARWDLATGKLLQDSLVTIDDAGSISLPAGQTVDGVDVSALGGTLHKPADAAARAALTPNIGDHAWQQDTGTWWIWDGAWVQRFSGPSSSTDHAISRWDSTTGRILLDSLTTVDDSGNISLPAGATVDGVDISTIPIGGILHKPADAAARAALTPDTGDHAWQQDTGTWWIWDGSAWVQRFSGPGSSTDHAVPRWDSTTGRILLDSLVTVDDSGNVAIPASSTVDGRDVSEIATVHKPVDATARAALTAQKGDEAQQQDDGSWWIYDGTGWLQRITSPGASTDNAVARYDGVTGKLIQTSGLTVDDSGNISATGTAHLIKLDDWATPDDNNNLDATTSEHGLLRKLDNDAAHYLDGQGNWTTPAGTSQYIVHLIDGTTQTGNFTGVVSTHHRYDPSGGSFNVTLPAAAAIQGAVIELKNVTNSRTPVTVLPTGGDTIDYGPSQLLNQPLEWSLWRAVGTNWSKVS